MFEIIARNLCDRNGEDTTVIKWHGSNQYQTVRSSDLRYLQAAYNEFVPAGKGA